MPERDTRVQELKSELAELVQNLEIGQMFLEEPELLAQHVAEEIKQLSQSLTVEIEQSDLISEQGSYPLQRVVLKIEGEKGRVLVFLRDIARSRPQRLCRLVDLELQRGPECWSGRVRADFFLRGGRKNVDSRNAK